MKNVEEKTQRAQSNANKKFWEMLASAAKNGPQLSAEARAGWTDSNWQALTTEASDVGYEEVNANGIKAMWITPLFPRWWLYKRVNRFAS
jgi:hypothetical protein